MARIDVGERGEYATNPFSMPRKGWWQALQRVYQQVSADNLSVVAAGVAFFGLLAIFPGLAALVILYGLIADPNEVAGQLQSIEAFVPADAYGIIEEQLKYLSGREETKLTFGLILSLALTVWSATKGAKSLMTAMNIAYEEEESRGFIAENTVAVALTLGGLLFVLLSFAVVAAIPALVEVLSLGAVVESALLWLRWVVMALFAMLAFGLIYRFAPHRQSARIQWLTPGAIAGTLLWLVGSVAFSFYVSHIGDYSKTFGSLGAVVTLLMWFYISAYIVCIGAELNAELEHQTYRDSTTGPARPAGRRGAYVADHTAADKTVNERGD